MTAGDTTGAGGRVVPQVSNEAWLAGYRWALTHLDDPGVRADAGRYDAEEANREVPGTSVQVDDLHDRIALLEQRNGQLDADLHSSRLQHADLQSFTDQLERKLRSVTEERNQLQVRARVLREDAEGHAGRAEAAEVAASSLKRQLDELRDAPGPFAGGELLQTSELLEAQGGVFVPIPAGHMVSLSVAPYSSEPAD